LRARLAKVLGALGSVAMLVGAISSSADAETHPEADAWQFELAPHLWIAEIDGSVTVRGRVRGEGQPEQTLSAAVSEGGLVGGSGRFEARKRRLTLFLDAMGTEADTVGDLGEIFGETTSGEVYSDLALVEFGAAYRIVDWRFAERALRSFWIEGLAGGRYVHLGNDLQVDTPVRGNSIHFEGKADADVVDPFIGARWSLGLLDDLALLFSGDVGGFGAGTRRTWQLVSMLRYRLPWEPCSRPIWASAGYHVIDFEERGHEVGGRETKIDLQFRGPILGLAMQF